MNKHKVIYLPVSAKIRLPKVYGLYLVEGVPKEYAYYFDPADLEDCEWWIENNVIWLEPLSDQYIFTRDQLAEYLSNYSFHMSGAYNKNNAEKYIDTDWRNYKQE